MRPKRPFDCKRITCIKEGWNIAQIAAATRKVSRMSSTKARAWALNRGATLVWAPRCITEKERKIAEEIQADIDAGRIPLYS